MEKKYYPLYVVDICTASYAMHWVIVGAKSKKDLLEHWDEIFKHYHFYDDNELKWEGRIMRIKTAFTITPYKVIDEYVYFE